MESFSDSEIAVNPEEIVETANSASLDLLPSKSRARYKNVHQVFKEFNEDVIFAYL